MKKCIILWGLLVLAVSVGAETGFLQNLPREDFASAGLQKLTPEELARLETLFQRFKTGEVTVVQQQAEARAQASQEEAQRKIIMAEQKAKAAVEKADAAVSQAREAAAKAKAEAEVAAKAEAVPAAAKNQPRWYAALLTLNRAREKPEKEEPMKSRLVGDFTGWNGGSIYTLENGTRWAQQNRSDQFIQSPVLHSPVVKITPATLTGFWLEIEGVNKDVRVIPYESKEQK